jgi:hypothetical protein
MNKRGYEFSFAWIFTLLIGAVIIFLAIYAAFQFSDTLRFGRDSATAKRIGVLITPLETNLESGRSYPLVVSEETTIYNDCVPPRDTTNFFGSQDLAVAVKSQVAVQEGSTPGVKSRFNNKYIFSDNVTTADSEFYVMSKPFYYPFKIADLTIIWSDNEEYCFVNPNTLDSDIEEEIKDLQLQNVKIETEPCEDEINVCFDNNDCEIKVTNNEVTKRMDGGTKTVRYTKSTKSEDEYALLFAAIFSHPDEYKCQINRLAARAESLAKLYLRKSEALEDNGVGGCANLVDPLKTYRDHAEILKGKLQNPDFEDIQIAGLNNGLCNLY